ncbi:MAG: DUF2281 domain-containing protein [Magnetococcales bacterium]|nr:DUF2281 domain-containing protein [Magnetococcales bacterium]
MTTLEQIYTEAQQLPDEIAVEVLDFIRFLACRHGLKQQEEDRPKSQHRMMTAESKKALADMMNNPYPLKEGCLITQKSVKEFSGPLAVLRAHVADQYGDMQPMIREEIYDTDASNDSRPNGTRMAELLTEMAEKNIGEIFGDPLEWQKEIRTDRPLPGR